MHHPNVILQYSHKQPDLSFATWLFTLICLHGYSYSLESRCLSSLEIDRLQGNVSLISKLNYENEMERVLECRVYASDNNDTVGSNQGEATIKITLQDIVDEPPKFEDGVGFYLCLILTCSIHCFWNMFTFEYFSPRKPPGELLPLSLIPFIFDSCVV